MVSNLTNHSAVEADYPPLTAEPQPDRNFFPLYHQAKKVECYLNPGDMLYIPRGWWHWIFSEDEAIAVNFWVQAQPTTSANQVQLDIDDQPRLALRDRAIAPNIFQQQYLATNQPLLIKQGATQWSAMNLWQRDYLANIQDLIIPQFFSGAGQHSSFAPVDKPYFKDSNRNKEIKLFPQIKFQKLCEIISEKSQLNYVAFLPLSQNSSLLNDIKIPDLLEKQVFDSINFWYSYGNLHTGLHYDDYENILVLVKGKKRVFLYPPSQSQLLYSQNLPILFNYVSIENL